MTYERRLSNVPGKAYAQKKLTRFAVQLDTLPRSRRWDAFNEVLNQIVGETSDDAAYGPIPYSGLPMPLRTKPLTALASQIGSLPEPARRVSAFNDALLKAYRDLTAFASNSTGTTRKQMEEERPELHKALASAIIHLPEDARAKPLTALISQIGSLPDPVRRVSEFNYVLKAYGDLIEFASNSTGITRMEMEDELPELHKALESAINHLPEDARPEALESLNAIG